MDQAMKVFYTVATEGSFSKAADMLYVSQSNISYSIKKLEKELNVTLIERQHNGIRLTSAGQRVLVYAEEYLENWDKLQGEMRWYREYSDTPLNVGATYLISDHVIQNFVQPFRDRSKDHRIVNMAVGNSRDIMTALRGRKVDFAFVSEPIDQEGCVAEPFLRDEIVLVVSRDHPWRQEPWVTLDMLQEQPYVSREEGSGTRKMVESKLAEAGLDVGSLQVGFIGSNYSTVLQAVENGIGYSLVPLSAIQKQLANQRLFTVNIRDFSIHRAFLFVALKNTLRVPAQRRLYYRALNMLRAQEGAP